METLLRTANINGWMVRYRLPSTGGTSPVCVLLHGLTGDEKSMWIFANRIPSNYLVIAPRGLFMSPVGGYSWYPPLPRLWPNVDDLRPAVDALNSFLSASNFPLGDFSKISLVGFSQGAALAYLFASLLPQRIDRVMGLAGFLPEGADELLNARSFLEMRIFIAHGSRDRVVPVQMARQAAQAFSSRGAQVTYCEEDVGHKLGVGCFRGLEAFFNA